MDVVLPKVTEDMRLKLLKEERKMREKQPEPWTKTKYRKYANFGSSRARVEEAKKAKDTKEAK